MIDKISSLCDYNRYRFCGVDVETTGLDHNGCEVIEVACIEFDAWGNIGHVYNQICSPLSGYIPPKITELTGITAKDTDGMPNYLRDGIRETIAEMVGDRTLVAHNLLSFDIKFLKIIAEDMIDTLLEIRKRFPQGKNNLKAACKRYGIEWDDEEAHRASYDVKQMIKMLVEMWKREDESNQADLFEAVK